ncbi:MAG: NYN domain-containing protein [Deltaproteobacteria bacterium]|nr:MAG: NYN domain-containing protein [Deltaproteobacteria bacterium]
MKPVNIAVLVDFENVAIGARDAKLEPFDIERVLERLLDKGKVIVKRAYSDWARYASSRKGLHEAGFELVEVPHVSYSGKNSADIRMAVDAVDMSHVMPHIDLFAIISGDSDFSPLVGKLRANDKEVLGVGVRDSTSRLLVESCDEFLFYDDLVERPKEHSDKDPAEALQMVLNTASALIADRGEPVWGSHVKQVLKRKRPHFAERRYGYKSFNDLLEDLQVQGSMEMRKDERSGGYVVTSAA